MRTSLSCWSLVLVAATACGRVGFDPIESDAGTPTTGKGVVTGAGCGGVVPGCDATTQTIVAGESGELRANTALDADTVASSCGGAGAGDVVARLAFSETVRVQLSLTASFDTVLSIRAGSCTGPEIECVDIPHSSGETAIIDGIAGQTIAVVADGAGACGLVVITWES